MSWWAAGAAVVSAGAGYLASDKAADKVSGGNRAGIEEQRRQFDTIMGLQQPYMVTGTGAYNKIARLLGLPYQEYSAPGSFGGGDGVAASNPRAERGTRFSVSDVKKLIKRGMSVEDIAKIGFLGGNLNRSKVKRLGKKGLDADDIVTLRGGPPGLRAAEAGAATDDDIITPDGPDMSEFTESPDYRFRLQEGSDAIDRGAAARGGALSGNAVRAGTEFASNMASTEYGNFFERLMRVAGLGGAATNNVSGAAANMGNNVSGLLTQQGNARASGILGQANSVTGAINTGLNNWLLQRGGYFGPKGAG